MGSFLERISLLESKLPAAKAYKTILIRVFSAVIVLCGLTTKSIAKGRFSMSRKLNCYR
jgi:hypothetical protein